MKEKEGRIHALGTLTEKGFKVMKSAAGGHRSTFIISENKPVIISTSSIFDVKRWQTHPSQATLAHYFFAYVLVHGPTGDIHIMPGEDYRKKSFIALATPHISPGRMKNLVPFSLEFHSHFVATIIIDR